MPWNYWQIMSGMTFACSLLAGLFDEFGFSDITSKDYPVEMRKESRSQMGFFTTGYFVSLLGKMLKVIFGRDPFARDLIERSWSNPRQFNDFIGYGLSVDWNG